MTVPGTDGEVAGYQMLDRRNLIECPMYQDVRMYECLNSGDGGCVTIT